MALAHRLSGIIRVATRWLRIISTNYISYVLIFLPCSDSVGETFRSVGGLGPPAEYFQWGTNIASLLTFVSGGGISDIRPACVHYLSALWGLREPARHISQSPTIHYLAFGVTRRCLLLVSNQTLLAGKGVILLLVVNLKIYLSVKQFPDMLIR